MKNNYMDWLLRSSQDFVKESIKAGCYDTENQENGGQKFLVAMFFTGLCEELLHGWLLRSSQNFVKEIIKAGCYDTENQENGILVAIFLYRAL